MGYTLVATTCVKVEEANKNCNRNEINYSCKIADVETCTCTTCHYWAYGDHCCALGTRWDSNHKKCINNDDYCAK